MRRFRTLCSPASARTRRRSLRAGLILALTVGMSTAGATTVAPVLPPLSPSTRTAHLLDTLTEIYTAHCVAVKATTVSPNTAVPLGYVERICITTELLIDGLQGDSGGYVLRPKPPDQVRGKFCLSRRGPRARWRLRPRPSRASRAGRPRLATPPGGPGPPGDLARKACPHSPQRLVEKDRSMPGLALPATPCRRRSQPGDRWRQWQDSTVSQRLLSARDRQYGYTVVWIPPPLREAFLDVAQAFRLYDALIHKPQRVLSG